LSAVIDGTFLEPTPALEVIMAKKSLEKRAVREVEALAENISDRLADARLVVRDWQGVAASFIKKSPGLALGGAFLLGFALSRAARHA
jgi:hypothetical protein